VTPPNNESSLREAQQAVIGRVTSDEHGGYSEVKHSLRARRGQLHHSQVDSVHGGQVTYRTGEDCRPTMPAISAEDSDDTVPTDRRGWDDIAQGCKTSPPWIPHA